MAKFLGSNVLRWQVGLETDIGGGRENQDDCFVWIKKDENIIVLCVLDGHGREEGKIASESAKTCLFNYLDENYAKLLENPVDFLVRAHEVAHNHIRDTFKAELERHGFEVQITPENYLIKRKQAHDSWAGVLGGTSCSIAAVVGSTLYVANVGDSSGVLCSSHGVFTPSDLVYVKDAAETPEYSRNILFPDHNCSQFNPITAGPRTGTGAEEPAGASVVSAVVSATTGTGTCTGTCTSTDNTTSSGSKSNSSNNNNSNSTTKSDGAAHAYEKSQTLILTAEHSPECPYEYGRLHRFRARDGNPLLPALLVVYDSSSNDKSRCAPVFERDAATGKPFVSNKGR
jgi:hypothetical protein